MELLRWLVVDLVVYNDYIIVHDVLRTLHYTSRKRQYFLLFVWVAKQSSKYELFFFSGLYFLCSRKILIPPPPPSEYVCCQWFIFPSLPIPVTHHGKSLHQIKHAIMILQILHYRVGRYYILVFQRWLANYIIWELLIKAF